MAGTGERVRFAPRLLAGGALTALAARLRRRGRSAGAVIGHFERALGWIADQSIPGQGIRVTSADSRAYPEVTGYLIPTLLSWGERNRALRYARWLISIQHPSGAWLDPAGRAYTFDTGQVLKGLLAALPIMPEARDPIYRGCDWLLTQIEDSGRVHTPDASQLVLPHGRVVPDSIHLYAIEPLRRAAGELGRAEYREAVERVLHYYLSQRALTDFDTLSHFHAYVIEALIDLDCRDRAAEGMAEVERLQRRDGSVPAYRHVRWTCVPALAQYAVIWFRLGCHGPAERVFRRLCELQNRSGGFFGSHGRGHEYFPKLEVPWAVKYFLDALRWRILASFDASAASFPDRVGIEDGRYRFVEDEVRSAAPRDVLDAGCGKGRFIRLLQERNPGIRGIGLDLSDAMLAHLPPQAERIRGSLLQVPLPDGSVDLAFAVEALEHAVNVAAAIRELSRVVRRPGTLVIVDKDRSRRGALEIRDWERWFSPEEVTELLESNGFRVEVHDQLPYENSDGSDGLFLGWTARR